MKKKVKIACVLKSGVIVEDTIKIDKKSTQAFRAIDEMRKGIEKSLGSEKQALQNITFGKLTVAVSEIAAVKFKEY